MQVGGTCWVDHILQALTNVFKGYEAIVQHLQQLGENPKASSIAKSKAECFLKLLIRKDVMQFLSLLHDVVSALSIIFKVFQKERLYDSWHPWEFEECSFSAGQ